MDICYLLFRLFLLELAEFIRDRETTDWEVSGMFSVRSPFTSTIMTF